MSRAYLRLDPAFDERKESYPDGPYAALIATFCLAELQAERGRFRSLDYLSRLLGKRGRHAKYLLAHGDLVALDDGRVYVEGWDEWQEGDWKVSERVARIRHRKDVTPDLTVGVTVPVTVGVTPDRLSVAELSVGTSDAVQPARDGLPNITAEAITFLEGVTGRSMQVAGDRQLTEYDRQIEDHGLRSVMVAYNRAAKTLPASPRPTARQLVWSAMRILEPMASVKDTDREERAAETDAAHQRRLAATQRELAAYRGEPA